MAADRRRLGAFGEKVAEGYLKRLGYRIVERNFRTKGGEIDIVACKGEYLVFVEVRTRGSGAFGLPEESVTRAKREKLIELAECYVQGHPGLAPFWRIDVVPIEIGPRGRVTRIAVIENAVC